jgi:hypothetical protein
MQPVLARNFEISTAFSSSVPTTTGSSNSPPSKLNFATFDIDNFPFKLLIYSGLAPQMMAAFPAACGESPVYRQAAGRSTAGKEGRMTNDK